MNTYMNAAVATEHQQQRSADAVEFRRSRTDRDVKAIRRRARSHRVSAFLKDLAAASV
jgi:hypothetical protein